MLKFSNIVYKSNRFYSNSATKTILESLPNRSLLRVQGNEAKEFLQGLVTNDINHLNPATGGSMYAMFLNTKGRVLYDSIIYKIEDNDTYFIECDSQIEKQLEKHLKMYRVRKKVDIISLNNEYKIYTLFKNKYIQKGAAISTTDKTEIDVDIPLTHAPLKLYKNVFVFKDPRVADLGCRIISKPEIDVKKELSSSIEVNMPDSRENYKLLRYSLGVGEGINDLPIGNCFPLESNCDYLHGVSFHKGCYIGQELTARTHHTGVVRKRLMPLFFTETPDTLPGDNAIKSDKVNLGKLRGIEQNVGLALLRIESALELEEFKVCDKLAKVWKPHWWPVELPKEKLNVQKT